jgi:hypothetical protein
MKKTTSTVTAALLSVGFCSVAIADSDTIYIAQTAPYSDTKKITRAILDECELPQQQSELIAQLASTKGILVVRDDEAVKAGKGRILQVEITDAISTGNAFIGHRKQVSVKGRLFDNGTEVGDFVGIRSSMGGAFAGYKGSCSVLGRCMKTLAVDISQWLKNPAKDSRIGE